MYPCPNIQMIKSLLKEHPLFLGQVFHFISVLCHSIVLECSGGRGVKFPGNNHYEGVRFYVISTMVGIKFLEKSVNT